MKKLPSKNANVMARERDYTTLLEKLKSVPEAPPKRIKIPVHIFIQEGENLAKWILHDKEALEGAGLDWSLADSLPIRVGTLRLAESNWIVEHKNRRGSREIWNKEVPKADVLRSKLIHDFRYAYHHSPHILECVRKITSNKGQANRIQDLNSLAALGKKWTRPLLAINYDMTVLDETQEMAQKMSRILADSSSTITYQESLELRNKAYMHLKEAVDTIRRVGKYVFWKYKARRTGYVSSYFKKLHSKNGS